MHFFHLLFLMTVLSRSNLSRLWVSDVRHAIEYAKPPSRPPSHSPAVLFTCVTSLVECSSLCMRQKAYILGETRAVPERMQTGFATIQTVPKLERCAVLLGFPFLFSFFLPACPRGERAACCLWVPRRRVVSGRNVLPAGFGPRCPT